MDFITHLPRTRAGYDTLLFIMDYITKMMILRPTHSMVMGGDITRIFMDAVIRVHGVSQMIMSDRDIRFTNNF